MIKLYLNLLFETEKNHKFSLFFCCLFYYVPIYIVFVFYTYI